MRGFEYGLESWILSYLLNSLWQVPLLFAAGWVVARMLRRAGAAMEHRVWVSVLLIQSLLPACSTFRWDWLSRVFFWSGVGGDANGAHVTVVMGAGTAAGGLHLPSEVLATVAMAYATLAVYFVARFLWNLRRLRSLRSDAIRLGLIGEAAVCWIQCAKRFRIDKVSIAASSEVFGPVTMGFREKLVLFPTGMLSSLNEADLRTVMAHEFAHMRRDDFFKNLIYELFSLPVSYHPLLWLTRERVTESREIVCDQMAAEMGGRVQYAHSLLRLASLLLQGVPAQSPHAIGIFDTRTFERRLMRLAEMKPEIRGVRRLTIVLVCAAFGVGTCGSALALRMYAGAGTPVVEQHAAKTPKTISVPPQVIAGQRIGGAFPKYPEQAKKDKVQGQVVLDALIGKDGSIVKVTVASGPEELRESAIDAVRTWKYKPFLLNGNPVQVKTKINIVYSLGR